MDKEIQICEKCGQNKPVNWRNLPPQQWWGVIDTLNGKLKYLYREQESAMNQARRLTHSFVEMFIVLPQTPANQDLLKKCSCPDKTCDGIHPKNDIREVGNSNSNYN